MQQMSRTHRGGWLQYTLLFCYLQLGSLTGEQHKRKYTQTFLDLGQRSYGKRTLCPDCGLLYVNGESQDERDHAAFCKSVTDGVSL
eukprot:20621-Eustigmatos_ZCMA.PRE.1